MTQWILLAVIAAILAVVVAMAKLRDRRLAQRLKAARCPGCGNGFPEEFCQRPQIHARIKIVGTGNTTEVRYRLHCSGCQKDYFAASDGTLIDEIKEETMEG